MICAVAKTRYNIYLQFLFYIQLSGSIFRHRSGKHFQREIYTTNLDLQKKRYLNYLNENEIMYVWCGEVAGTKTDSH